MKDRIAVDQVFLLQLRLDENRWASHPGGRLSEKDGASMQLYEIGQMI